MGNGLLQTDTIALEIVQVQQSINGQIIIIKDFEDNTKKEIKNLNLNGKIIDGCIMLYANNTDKRYQSFLTYLLKVTKGGKCLEGEKSWVDSNEGGTHSGKIQFNRNS